MYEFQGIRFGPTEVTVEADSLRGALDQMGQLYNLHKDALFLEAHVEFFYDTEPMVVPSSRDDREGYKYRGFECLETGCNITFKEDEQGGMWPGRYAAYVNGDDRPKLYDPNRSPEEILETVAPSTLFVKKYRVNLGKNGGAGRPQPQGPPSAPPQPANGSASTSSSQKNGDEDDYRQKVNKMEAKLRSAPLAERPDMLARLARWKNGKPSWVQETCNDLIVDYATDQAFNARMEQMDQKLEAAEEDELEALCEEEARKAGRWPPHYQEAAYSILSAHAPKGADIRAVRQGTQQTSEPQPAN